MEDEIRRLEAELAKIEGLIATEEALRETLPSAQVETIVASWEKQAEELRAKIAVAGNVTGSQFTIGDENQSVQDIQASQGGVVIVSAGDVHYNSKEGALPAEPPKPVVSRESLEPPFTAPKPNKRFVQRSKEYEQLLELLGIKTSLLSRVRGWVKKVVRLGKPRAVALTTALQGGGGFGKTTLAKAICHDERVKAAFPDGIVWVTIGQTPNLVRLLNQQIQLLSHEPPIADVNLAAARWQALLTDKRLLVVLDDVWQLSYAKPFVPQSPTCALLLTTRQREVAHRLDAQAVDINQMRPQEGTELLLAWLDEPPSDIQPFRELAHFLGQWPLLLELAAGQLRELVDLDQVPLSEAISELRHALKEKGFTAFDRRDEGQRNQAISISLAVSLEHLEKENLQTRFLELAIFPEDTDIPFETIGRLWANTANWSPKQSTNAIRTMQRYSLFTHYNPHSQVVRLHDVIRALLVEQQDERLPTLHTQLLNTYHLADWTNLPPDEPYLWHHLTYHLRQAGRLEELRAPLFNFDWLQAKLNATDINALISDYNWLANEDKDVERVQRTLRQASHILAEDKQQLAGQLIGRLLNEPSPAIQQLLTNITLPHPWLRPLTPSLQESSALIRTLQGHTGWVNGVAVTPDGRVAISASYDKTLKVWDIESGQELYELRGHAKSKRPYFGGVNGVAVTPDGRLAISASDFLFRDHMLKVWDIESGQQLKGLRGHTFGVTGVAVTPNGRLAISTSNDKTLKVWNIESGQQLKSWRGHTDMVTGVAVTPDGRLAISASLDGTLKVWDIESGQELYELRGHAKSKRPYSGGVNGVAVTPDGRLAISASSDHTLKVWDIESGQELYQWRGHTDRVNGVAVTPDGRLAISASLDGTLKVWDIESGQELSEWRGHTDRVKGVAVTPDGRLAISASYDKTLKVWDIESRQELYQWRGHTDSVWEVAVTPDGRLAISVSRDNTLKVWDIESSQELKELRGHTDEVTGVAVTPDGRLAISASYDKTLKVWDIESGQELYEWRGHTNSVNGVAVTPDGRLAISASSDHTLKVWHVESGQERHELRGHTSSVNAVAVTPNGRLAISASYDKTLKVWDIKSGQKLHEWRGHTDSVNGVAVTPDGRLAISASRDQMLKVWDIKSGQKLHEWRGHTDRVNGVAVTPNGRLAISASEDKTLKVWQLSSGLCLTKCHLNDDLRTCAVAPDGVTIMAGGASGRVHFLRLEGVLSTDLGSGLNG